MSCLRALTIASLACSVVLSLPPPARAGDRGVYLVLVDERGHEVQDPRRDAFERAFFECGEEPLAACRASHVPGSDHDGDTRPIYAAPSSAIDLALVQAARTSPRGRTALVDALNERGLALDGILMLRAEPGGRLSLTLINLNARTVSRLPLRSDGTLADGHRARAQRFFARGWVP